jgi:CubicO group peptidase (beta-lactamase class C family)
MKMNKFAAAAFLLLCHLTAFPQSKQIDKFLQNEMRERRIPGMQVAVVQRGRIAYLRSFGIADLQNNVPVTDKSVFAINSCTKAFTGVAMMQLVEEGKVDLSAPVAKYLDDLPEAWRAVTVRQLLTHVSGLPDVLRVLENPAGKTDEDAAWKDLQTRPMDFATGERFAYNQTNYLLLGKIIDKFRGKPFADVFAERQFKIAGLTKTGFGDSLDVIANKATSYRYVKNNYGHALAEEKLTPSYEEFPYTRRTASGMNSTAEDVAKWLIALQAGKLLKPDSVKTLWAAGQYNNGSPTQWALGWVTKPRPTHSAVVATGGGRAAFFVYPADDLAVVVLSNLAGSYPEDFVDELAGFYRPEIAAADPVTALRMALRKRGYGQASDVYAELKKKDAAFAPSETDLNDWAYRLLAMRQNKPALEILKLNMGLFPNSSNVYDSVAEGYQANGDIAQAIKNYRRSLELDPGNKNAIGRLKKLEGDGKP